MPRQYFKTDPAVRFWRKVDKSGECWLWTGFANKSGYGVFAIDHGITVSAHRYAYDELVGLNGTETLDHACHTNDTACAGGLACRHRRCVNPAHLEPVSRSENTKRAVARRTQCKNGHPYDEENTRFGEGYGRRCRECARAAGRRAYWKRKLG